MLSDIINIDTSVLTMDYLVENCEAINNQIMANMDSVDFELALTLIPLHFKSVQTSQYLQIQRGLPHWRRSCSACLALTTPTNLLTTRRVNTMVRHLHYTAVSTRNTYEIEMQTFTLKQELRFLLLLPGCSLLGAAASPLTVVTFLKLINKPSKIVNGISKLDALASGTFYAYACDRTQIVQYQTTRAQPSTGQVGQKMQD